MKKPLKPEVDFRAWIKKAESDFKTAEHILTLKESCPFDTVCFHAQQCVEKYLKARLCEAGRRVYKVHDLAALLDAVVAVEPLWESYRADLAYLSEFAVRFRYPGEAATKVMAQRARQLCRSFRTTARQALGLR